MDLEAMVRKVKPEPVEADLQVMEIDENDDEVAAEFDVILLKAPQNSSIDRLIFQQQQPQSLNNCTGRLKKQVKHVEFNYKSGGGRPASDEKTPLYDGTYTGESITKNDPLLRNAVGFFKEGRFYLLPVQDSYSINRKISRPAEINVIEQNRIDDAKLAMMNEEPTANPARIRFARQETDWQRKRREQSSQHRQLMIDQDPWINVAVVEGEVQELVDDQT